VVEGTDCTGRQVVVVVVLDAEVQDSELVVRAEIAMGVNLSVGLD
jgi:hypothetical protein